MSGEAESREDDQTDREKAEDSGKLQLSPEEEQFLVWAEQTKTAHNKFLDVPALEQIGLGQHEIDYLRLVWDAYKLVGTPPGACGDSLRHLIWEMEYLPKQDIHGCITVQSFLNSVGPIRRRERNVMPEDYFLSLRYAVRHAEEGGYDHYALCGIYRKILKWCQVFASIHGLKEKHVVGKEGEQNDRTDDRKVSADAVRHSAERVREP